MHAEVTHQAFRALVPVDTVCTDVEEHTAYRKQIYKVHGIEVIVLENYVSCCTQYYVTDLNY